jgi:hypothetical protein
MTGCGREIGEVEKWLTKGGKNSVRRAHLSRYHD